MRAIRFDAFGEAPHLAEVPAPRPQPGGIVVKVGATGLCRSDWHGWQGHDPDIRTLPHTPGHEFAGTVHDVGEGVQRVRVGDRVVVPFVCGCGRCDVCRTGATHVCPDQWQPGFSGPGAFAELVAVPAADVNAVHLPGEVSTVVAAGLGCRFATAYRGVLDVAKVQAGESMAVFGCGGVGLSAVMIAASLGADVLAIDVDGGALDLAREVGAVLTVDGSHGTVEALRAWRPGGVDVAVDALGSVATARAATQSLAVHGRQLQIGLLPPAVVGDRASVPMHEVIARELQVLGSHGMPARDYPRMLADVAAGVLAPQRFLTRTITLEEVPAALMAMGVPGASPPGVSVAVP